MKKTINILLAVLILLGMASAYVLASDYTNPDRPAPETVVIDAPSGSKGPYTVLNDSFTDKNGEIITAVIYPLTKENEDAVMKAIRSHYTGESKTPLKLVHKDFVDAEKWSAVSEDDPFSDVLMDDSLCWAASTSNILWSSGWARDCINPLTHKNFSSEDDLFNYFCDNFANKGGEAEQGLEWFFNGTYISFGRSGSPWIESEKNMGFRTDLYAGALYDTVEMINNPSGLKVFEENAGKITAYEAGIGTLTDDVAYNSCHSVTVTGILYDPEYGDAAQRYKAIILADPDNDAYPVLDPDETSDDERIADRAKRPNSYTIYPLSLITDAAGNRCWEITGYSDTQYVLYSLNVLPGPEEGRAESAAETEGSCDAYKDPDFLIRENYLSNVFSEIIMDETYPVQDFKPGENIYYIFKLANRGLHFYDGERITVSVLLTVYKDGVIADNWTEDFSIANTGPNWYLQCIQINRTALSKGNYVVKAEVNPVTEGNRALSEAYCRNNYAEDLSFTVDGGTVIPVDPPVKPVKPQTKNMTFIWIIVVIALVFLIVFKIFGNKIAGDDE